MTIRTGIGGWTYAPWREAFYPDDLRQKDELSYAAGKLGAIEVNGTFYRLQKPETFANWRAQTPEGFAFALKGSRYIVTRKKLAQAGEAVDRFFAQGIAELGDRLGPILWQMPKSRAFDAVDMRAFFDLLPGKVDGLAVRHVIEVQNESFACAEFYNLARRCGIAIAYIEALEVPTIDERITDFRYARIKTMQSRLKRGLPRADLERLAEKALTWAEDGGDVFAFCINGAKERAPVAAMALAKRIATG
ncbi:DUF72 domain-containing protein [Croceicoccus naphthovorans]|uniref:Uncharacterized protein n=1 Tax=Croceicoccus naphthovorans TaxID=1348774 RepID=A0A0G3XHE8_9SPHN|nr:DUF72 domain-containing protein [Croceicoccus naphthovorans]AKM09823.1 hypothetical protein AB433_07230 [Croceicoccus naphthovorans]MBB3991258.1 uncharacterized protein YecE (DUF72 family) [Croceicoccus naphthovorans]